MFVIINLFPFKLGQPVTYGGSFYMPTRLMFSAEQWLWRWNEPMSQGVFSQRYYIKPCYGGKSQLTNEEWTLSFYSTDFILALFSVSKRDFCHVFILAPLKGKKCFPRKSGSEINKIGYPFSLCPNPPSFIALFFFLFMNFIFFLGEDEESHKI